MGSVFRQKFNKRKNLSIDIELKNQLDKLFIENCLLKTRFNRFETIYQQWINDERIYLLKRIEKLENDHRQFHQICLNYEKSLQSITNLILKILFIQQELRKQYTKQHDPVQWRMKRPQNEIRSLSCQLDDSRYSLNDQSICFQQDEKTRNYSSESNNHSTKLATGKSKSDKLSTAQANKLYYVLNNEKTPIKPTRDNHRSQGVNITSVDDTKQRSSVTFNKNQSQTRSTYSNHQRLPTQTSYRTPSIIKKNIQTKTTTSVSKPPGVPTITVRPPTIIHTRQPPPPPPPTLNQNKSPRPRITPPKSSESVRSVSGSTPRPRSGQGITNKPNTSPSKTTTTNNIKTRIPIISQQSTRATDLDIALAKQETKSTDKPTKILPPSIIQPSLFTKDTVKIVRPVRSQELKLFSCHLTPEISLPTNESLSTLTPSSFDSINDNQLIESKLTSNINRDFSEDSLNEHYHIKKLLQQNSTNNQEYFLLNNENLNSPYAPSFSLIQSKPKPSLIHRLVFPERLGRMIFYRRILSDSDIYQKICSKDNEILHNVYHLDTIRDYSMEFYMLTTYASDSQLRAWLDGDDDEHFDQQLNENRFQSSDDEINKYTSEKSNSVIEELDWYSEIELANLTKENIPNENHIKEFSPTQQTSTDSSNSSDLTSASWNMTIDISNQLHSTPLPSDTHDPSNSILREILNHSWTDHLSTSNSIEHETGIEQFENDSTSSIITDEFQPDFYYLCPITATTSFSKIDSKT